MTTNNDSVKTAASEANQEVITEKILLPVRKDVSEHIDTLEAQKETILKYFTGIGCGSHGAGTSLNFKAFLPLYIKYMMNPEYPSYYSYRYLQEKKTLGGLRWKSRKVVTESFFWL